MILLKTVQTQVSKVMGAPLFVIPQNDINARKSKKPQTEDSDTMVQLATNIKCLSKDHAANRSRPQLPISI